MIKVMEQILGKMVDAIGGIKIVANVNAAPDKGDGSSKKTRNKHENKEAIEMLGNPNLGDNNCRIKAKESPIAPLPCCPMQFCLFPSFVLHFALFNQCLAFIGTESLFPRNS